MKQPRTCSRTMIYRRLTTLNIGLYDATQHVQHTNYIRLVYAHLTHLLGHCIVRARTTSKAICKFLSFIINFSTIKLRIIAVDSFDCAEYTCIKYAATHGLTKIVLT
jgi:hypothetical protein